MPGITMSKPTITSTSAGHSFTHNGRTFGPYSKLTTAEHMRKVAINAGSTTGSGQVWISDARAEKRALAKQ